MSVAHDSLNWWQPFVDSSMSVFVESCFIPLSPPRGIPSCPHRGGYPPVVERTVVAALDAMLHLVS